MCVRCGTGSIAWCTSPSRHGEFPGAALAPGEAPPEDKDRENAERLAAQIGTVLGKSFAHFIFGVDGTLYCELCTEEIADALATYKLSDAVVAALDHDVQTGHEA